MALRKQRLEGTVLVLVLVLVRGWGRGQKVLVGRVFFNTMISAHPIMSMYSTYCTCDPTIRNASENCSSLLLMISFATRSGQTG